MYLKQKWAVYLTIVLFHGKPTVTDEEEFLVCLHVSHHQVDHIPGSEFPFPGIVVPDADEIQRPQ